MLANETETRVVRKARKDEKKNDNAHHQLTCLLLKRLCSPLDELHNNLYQLCPFLGNQVLEKDYLLSRSIQGLPGLMRKEKVGI